MKIKILTAVFAIASIASLHAQQTIQTPRWLRSDREMLYSEGLSMMSIYKGITQAQKEAMAGCYLKTIEEKYTGDEYKNKIEFELKQIKSSAIDLCSKQLSITLTTEEPKKEETKKEETKKEPAPVDNTINMVNLSGTWIFESESFDFSESGNYLYEASTRKCNGTWSLTEKVISLMPSDNVANKFALCKAEQYSIVKYSVNELVILKVGTNKKYTLKRAK